MAAKRMGYAGKLYYGAAGATATTEITNCRDVTITFTTDKGDTTGRDSGSPPIETMAVTTRKFSISWTMLNKASDTTLSALLTAVYAGTEVAIRGKDHSSGMGPDADFILEVTHGQPLRGEQTYEFTAVPTETSRTPSLWS